jgi:hypothetical protein
LEFFEYFIHPNYDKVTAYYDVAVLQIEDSIEFSNAVGPICLPQESSEDIHKFDNNHAEIIGRGSKNKLTKNSPRLRRVSLKVYPNRYVTQCFLCSNNCIFHGKVHNINGPYTQAK